MDSANISVGSDVYTADKDKIGQVKEVLGDLVKVDAKLHPDYWLSRQNLVANPDGTIQTTFNKQYLEDFKIKDLPAQAG